MLSIIKHCYRILVLDKRNIVEEKNVLQIQEIAMFNAAFKREDDELIVALEGRLDTLTSQDFEKELAKELTPNVHGLTIDVSNVEYISSAGLRTILAVQQYMEENDFRNVKMVHINDVIRDVFNVTGFDELVDIED